MSDRTPRRGLRPLPPEDGPPVQRLDAAIEGYLSTSGLAAARHVSELAIHWTEIVGSAIAEHCAPRTLRDGVLAVQVDHPAWVAELAFLESDVVEKARVILGPGVLRRVKVHVRGGFGVD